MNRGARLELVTLPTRQAGRSIRRFSEMAQLQPAIVATLPSIIPPPDPLHPKPRTLVLCFDGTGDQFDADVSPLAVVAFELPLICPRIRISFNFSRCCRRMTARSRWSIIRCVSCGNVASSLNLTVCLIGWNWHVHYPSNCHAILGAAGRDYRCGHCLEFACSCHAYVHLYLHPTYLICFCDSRGV